MILCGNLYVSAGGGLATQIVPSSGIKTLKTHHKMVIYDAG